jgi:signal transduction histidine kinase
MHRILFVDDEPAIPKSLQRMLRSYAVEAETETAGSADEALERIARGGIDVIVSDVRMPGMDGIELLTRLKANPATQNVPVIMLTGSGDSTLRNIALELGAAEFINKPADPTELCARMRNVMRLKAYQDQLVSQNDILSAQIIQAQKTEIAGILATQAAHDLNNILGAIVGNTELVLHKTSDCDVHPQLQRVIQAAQHAARLVSQIRDLGRRYSEEVKASDPCAVIEECLDFLRVLVPNGMAVDWVNPHLQVRTGVETIALHQIVMNLVINAVHAMGDSGTLSLKVVERDMALEETAPRSLAAGHYVVISVSDTGCGIDASIIPHIFEPFFTTKNKGQGTGVGLSVVSRIVRDKGGFVSVESSPGSGTTFAVHLPAVDVLEEPMMPAAVAAKANG